MKKMLGKVTFGLLCAFLVLYIFYNIYSLGAFFKIMGAEETFKYMFQSMNLMEMVCIIHNFFIGPLICWLIGLIYTIAIAQGKTVKRYIYLITALAIFDNLFFTIFPLDNISGFFTVFLDILFGLVLIAYCVCFILLFLHNKKQISQKSICCAFKIIYICTFVYGMIGFVSDFVRQLFVLKEIVLYNVFNFILWHGMRLVLFILGGLVLGYIFFPEKYIKTQEQNVL